MKSQLIKTGVLISIQRTIFDNKKYYHQHHSRHGEHFFNGTFVYFTLCSNNNSDINVVLLLDF